MMTGGDTRPDHIATYDVVVVGSGAAGLMAALHARSRDVALISKSTIAGGGSTGRAQGGVAAALGVGDSPDEHAADTLQAGCGLCDSTTVRLVTGEGPRRINELIERGAHFDTDSTGTLALGREGAHGRRRIVHAAGDATGAELVRALTAATARESRIAAYEQTLVLDLVVDEGRVIGVHALRRDGCRLLLYAPAVVLACGGVGQLYRYTTNPAEATGDGMAMAARAGARLAGLEFVQFHPTALHDGSRPMALLTEALRGEGAVLVDDRGSRVMDGVHTLVDLAPRDVVARAIWRRLADGERVFLDATALGNRLGERFPTVLQLCAGRGLDPRCEPIPVAPAAHYHMGGVVVDIDGHSSLPGLWACGEVAFTGLHGANRLVSNSLLETLVCGARVGDALASGPLPPTRPGAARRSMDGASGLPAVDPWIEHSEAARDIAADLRELMWRGVGLERSAAGMRRALEGVRELRLQAPIGTGELANMLLVGELVTRAAMARTESRGSHYRLDFPRSSRHWRQALVFEGQRMLEPRPIVAAMAV